MQHGWGAGSLGIRLGVCKRLYTVGIGALHGMVWRWRFDCHFRVHRDAIEVVHHNEVNQLSNIHGLLVVNLVPLRDAFLGGSGCIDGLAGGGLVGGALPLTEHFLGDIVRSQAVGTGNQSREKHDPGTE